jgi:hypothetical protein
LLLVYAISNAAGRLGLGPVDRLLAASAALLIAFPVIEARITAPFLPLRIRLKTPAGANAVSSYPARAFRLYLRRNALHAAGARLGAADRRHLADHVGHLHAFAGLSQALSPAARPSLVMAFGMTLIGAGIPDHPGAGARPLLG